MDSSDIYDCHSDPYLSALVLCKISNTENWDYEMKRMPGAKRISLNQHCWLGGIGGPITYDTGNIPPLYQWHQKGTTLGMKFTTTTIDRAFTSIRDAPMEKKYPAYGLNK